jgi:lipopolysaccharide/colanic/teichoic acid biosynthesis glycosyltransferase
MSDAAAIIRHPDLRRYLDASAPGGMAWVGHRGQQDHRGWLCLLIDLTVASIVACATSCAILTSPAEAPTPAILVVAMLAATLHAGLCATSSAPSLLRNRLPAGTEIGFAATTVLIVSLCAALLSERATGVQQIRLDYMAHSIAAGCLWAGITAALTALLSYGVERSRITDARVAVLGNAAEVAAFSAELRSGARSRGCVVAGVFDDRAAGDTALLLQLIVDGGVDAVALVIAPTETARLSTICETLADSPVSIYLVIDWAGLAQADHTAKKVATRSPVLAQHGLLPHNGTAAIDLVATSQGPQLLGTLTLVGLWRHPSFGMAPALKRCLDVAASLVMLVVLSPLLLIITLAVRVSSPGPVLFRQWRFGRGSVPFVMYKFRTMDALRGDPTGALRTQRVDPRVTRIGRLLRRTSLDELPQLFNVLSGEMSLVGPRPLPLHMRVGDDYYFDAVAHYRLRHRMKPGITGWAQINGSRGEIATLVQAHRRIDLDVHYIRNWSLMTDLRILALTLVRGFLTAAD